MKNGDPLLKGIRVVEAATVIMVPSAATILSDYGAEVIKVEPPGLGDGNRQLHLLPGMPDSDIAYCYMQLNRNKRGVAVNLKDEAGMEILLKLIETADVFVTNYRPQALRRLRLTYEDLKDRNPKLIYGQGSGFGEKGPEAEKPGYDVITYWTRSGIEGSMFPAEGWPGNIPAGSGDHPTGLSLFGAIMMGLYRRQLTGEGCKVSTSLIATGAWSNACAIQAQLYGAQFHQKRTRDQALNFSAVHYRASDGRIFKLAIVNVERDWPGFTQATGRPALAEDPRYITDEIRREHMPELIAELDEIFCKYDVAHWTKRLTQYDIPFAVIPTIAEIADDPQMTANDIFIEFEHSDRGPMRTVNSPINIQEEKKVPPKQAPELGQDTTAVLAELGYTENQIANLLERGVAHQHEG